MIPMKSRDMFNRRYHVKHRDKADPLNTSRVSDKLNVTRLKDTPNYAGRAMFNAKDTLSPHNGGIKGVWGVRCLFGGTYHAEGVPTHVIGPQIVQI